MDDLRIEGFLADLTAVATIVAIPTAPQAIVPHDADDDQIVGTAVAAKAVVLCTVDQHLHATEVAAYCRSYGIEVLTDRELMARFRELK